MGLLSLFTGHIVEILEVYETSRCFVGEVFFPDGMIISIIPRFSPREAYDQRISVAFHISRGIMWPPGSFCKPFLEGITPDDHKIFRGGCPLTLSYPHEARSGNQGQLAGISGLLAIPQKRIQEFPAPVHILKKSLCQASWLCNPGEDYRDTVHQSPIFFRNSEEVS